MKTPQRDKTLAANRLPLQSRRQLLVALGATTAAGLTAGCLGDDDDDNGDDTDDADDGDDEETPAEFMVSDLDPEDPEVELGEEYTVSATVENTGEAEGTQDIDYRVDGQTIETEELTVSGGDTSEVVFDVVLDELETGEYDHGVYSEDDEDEGTISVIDPASPFFEITGHDAGDLEVNQGDLWDVSVTIENTGADGTQNVHYVVEDEGLEAVRLDVSEEVTLDGGESIDVEFTDLDSGEIEIGRFDQEFSTNNQSETTGRLTVWPEDPQAATFDPATPIDLNGRQPGWEGISPAEIEDVVNPTIVLQAGETYELGWSEGDGDPHNIEIRDANFSVIGDYQTDVVGEPDEDQWIEFEATTEMYWYVCGPHTVTMVADILVVE